MIKIPPLGDYPDGYKPEVHGPYDPGRWYGKPDTPFDQVKFRDLPAWLSRRSLNPINGVRAFCRLTWRFLDKYHHNVHVNGVPYFQVMVMSGILFHILNWHRYRIHRVAKYH